MYEVYCFGGIPFNYYSRRESNQLKHAQELSKICILPIINICFMKSPEQCLTVKFVLQNLTKLTELVIFKATFLIFQVEFFINLNYVSIQTEPFILAFPKGKTSAHFSLNHIDWTFYLLHVWIQNWNFNDKTIIKHISFIVDFFGNRLFALIGQDRWLRLNTINYGYLSRIILKCKYDSTSLFVKRCWYRCWNQIIAMNC